MVAANDDEPGTVYDHRLARRLVACTRPYGWLVAGAVVLLLVEGALQLVGPLLTKSVIDDAIPARDAEAIMRATLLFAASIAASSVAQYGETLLTARLGQHVMHDLRTALFAKLQQLPIRYFDRTPIGRLVTRVTSDVEALNEMFTAGVVAGLGDVFTLLAIGTLMLVADWQLAVSAFAVIPFVYLTSHFFRKRVREAYREIRAAVARINAYLQERVTGMRVVQVFGRERTEEQAFERLNRAHFEVQRRAIRYYAVYFPAVELLTTIALAALIVSATGRIGAGTLTVGTVAAFLQLVRRFFQPLQDLADKFNTLQQAMAASERIFALLDEPVPHPGHELRDSRRERPDANPEVRDEGDETPEVKVEPVAFASRTTHVAPHGVTVEFEDVWFRYDRPHDATAAPAPAPEAEPEWVLRGISFTARPGETLALVGHTGAGKTTIVSLLLRFYDPQRGRILVGGTDVRELSIHELRSLIGYVQQEIFLFADDVASNIRLANPLPDAAVRAAAAQVGADRVIMRLPGGYAHRLGERGAAISVGERQLLSFARAIAADPAVLVLDEATSAVDSEVEGEIQRALATLMRGRTTIAIAHRLSTIVHADEILVLHHGEVRERGSHSALMAHGGLYERLYRLQAGNLMGPLGRAG